MDPRTMQYNPELAAAGDINALERDSDWLSVGLRAKDFVRRCLVLDEEKRMTATSALRHSWFANQAHKEEFERVYKRAVVGWRPRHRLGKGIMYVIDAQGNMSSVQSGSKTMMEESNEADSRQGDSFARKESVHTHPSNGKMVHFEDEFLTRRKKENMCALTISSDEEEEDNGDVWIKDTKAEGHRQEGVCKNVEITSTPPFTQCTIVAPPDRSRNKEPAQTFKRAQIFGFDASAWE